MFVQGDFRRILNVNYALLFLLAAFGGVSGSSIEKALSRSVASNQNGTFAETELKFLATSVSVFFPRCFRRVVARVYISEFRKYPGTECLHVNVMNMKNHRHMRLLPMMIVHMHGLASTEPATVSYRVRPTTKPIGVLRKCTTTRSRLRTGSTQPWITKG
ncbi:hypothetical protein Y032_0534g3066 [Ancylostoma ceylanicum]|uniref:Secreted protein n=1 Tax=Ancylostoma ceylanicum TaxID=53326 RepID=A0A016WSW5_9BILA|nr:hypothetical protein Y032_0534g3066 [Ancylostoma ceylanicum]